MFRSIISRGYYNHWYHRTDFTTASSRTLASHVAGSSRTLSTVSTRNSPPPKIFEFRPLLALPPLQFPQSIVKPPPRRNTFNQLSSCQIPLHCAQLPASLSPSYLPQPRPFNTFEPVYVRSASSPSPVEGAWGYQEGEHAFIEFQIEYCSSRRSGPKLQTTWAKVTLGCSNLGKSIVCLPKKLPFDVVKMGNNAYLFVRLCKSSMYFQILIALVQGCYLTTYVSESIMAMLQYRGRSVYTLTMREKAIEPPSHA